MLLEPGSYRIRFTAQGFKTSDVVGITLNVTETANVDRALASIDEEVRRIAAEGLTETELADCKQYLIGSIPRLLETNAAIAVFLGTAEFFGLGLDHDVRVPALLDAVTLDDVKRAAQRTLDAGRASVVVAGPYKR